MPSASNSGSGSSPPTGADVESWIEKIVDGGEGSVPRQVFLGGVSGWMTGFVAMKMGKAAAMAIGGGIILLQFAKYKGYIDINWNRLSRDVERVQKQIKREAEGKKDWTDKVPGTFQPTMSWLKQSIIDWLQSKNVTSINDLPLEKFTKPVLIAECKKIQVQPKYVIEELCEKSDKDVHVLWLPPAHCEFNAIELIWAIVKNYIATHNNSKNLNGILELSKEAISKVTPQMWTNCINHAKKYEEKMRTRDEIIDSNIDNLHRIVIPIGDENDTESESSSTDDSDSDESVVE